MDTWYELSGFSDEIDASVEKQFEHLNKLGIRYFEPRGINGKNIATLTAAEAHALKETMDRYGIAVSSIGSPIGKIGIEDDFEAHLEKLKSLIGTAKILGASRIRVFSFFIPDGRYAEFRGEVMRRMKAMAALAEKEGMLLLHENEKGIYGDNAARCLDILTEVNSPALKAVFDPSNFVQCGQLTFPGAFELLKSHIAYMHIKDCLPGGTVVPSGHGVGHVEEILRELKADGWTGFLSLEPHLGSFDGLDQLSPEDSRMLSSAKSSAEKFTLAYDALMAILERI